MSEKDFVTSLDPELYFKGLARQNLDFHSALGELVDNSFSARRIGLADIPENLVVEITIEQTPAGSVMVQVADNGIGISLDEITTKVFNLGGQGIRHGKLNEHGFGLKMHSPC
ncbi:ATP-binding protein [Rhodococcus erythropolis]